MHISASAYEPGGRHGSRPYLPGPIPPNAHGPGRWRATVRGMRRAGGLRVLLPLLLALLAATTGCTRAVAGAPSAAAPHAFSVTATPTPGSATAGDTDGGPDGGARDPTPTAPAGPSLLEPDVLPDECLLDAARFAALLGRRVRDPAQSVVRRADGSRSSSCYVGAAGDDPAPLAAINVYRVRLGTPAQFVRKASGGRTLSGVGEAAVVLDTVAGPTLQVASPRFVVTVAVQGREPADAAWRAAARHALARLTG